MKEEELVEQARKLIGVVSWTRTTSKEYEKTPHEWNFIPKSEKAKVLHSILTILIRDYGYDGWFYRAKFRYFDIDGYQYWIYDTIINRVRVEQSITTRFPPEGYYAPRVPGSEPERNTREGEKQLKLE